MDYTTLGRTGITVSRLCLGTMTFGREADEAASAALFHAARDAGITVFDCANLYAEGRSERILGRLIAEDRDDLIITSKVGMPLADDPNQGGLSRRHILEQVERSLRRLGTDRLDVYFCHRDDPATPVAETLRAMDDLVRRGMVRYVGVSNWSAWQTARGVGVCERAGLAPIHVIQPMYSLAKRTAEIEILPHARAVGLGVLTYSTLGGGVLTGKYLGQRTPEQARLTEHEMYAKRYADRTYHQIAEGLCAYAEEAGVHPATLAVAWVMAHPAVTAPIIGARNTEQLEPSLAAAEYDMSGQQWAELAALAPPVPLATDRDEERAEPHDEEPNA